MGNLPLSNRLAMPAGWLCLFPRLPAVYLGLLPKPCFSADYAAYKEKRGRAYRDYDVTLPLPDFRGLALGSADFCCVGGRNAAELCPAKLHRLTQLLPCELRDFLDLGKGQEVACRPPGRAVWLSLAA